MKNRFLQSLLIGISFCIIALGKTNYVNNSASGANDGISWTDAYNSFQSALDNASVGDEIWVAKGTYYPESAYGLTNSSRYYHFELIKNVKIYGGFSGSESDVTQRSDYGEGETNETILSGDIGILNDNSDNCYNIFYHCKTGLDTTALLDGFTIANGNADKEIGGAEPPPDGASLEKSTDIDAYHGLGGGMFNETSSPKIVNCTFLNNYAQLGGAIKNHFDANPVIIGCRFKNNTSGPDGGGAIFNNGNSTLTIKNCTFSNNSTSGDGGAICNYGAEPIITNSIFWYNSAEGCGGGIQNYDSSPTITNCLFYGNSTTLQTENYGGGMNYDGDSYGLITNCTFSNNSSYTGPALSCNGNSDVTVTNCIIWNNRGSAWIYNIYIPDRSTISYCDIENSGGSSDWETDNGIDGGNNIDVNPLFIMTGEYPFSLTAASPCLDKGDDSACSQIYDIRGKGYSRKLNKIDANQAGIIDMGAYEYGDNDISLPVKLISLTASINGNNVELLWQTESEVNNIGFDILRMTQNDNWEKIGFVEGNGNSSSPCNYSFNDLNPPTGTIRYKLKQIDLDGNINYSDEINVNLVTPDYFLLEQNYPNPFNLSTSIKINIPENTKVIISIYDINGRLIESLLNENMNIGKYTINWNADNICSGVYFINIKAGTFQDVKKCILLK